MAKKKEIERARPIKMPADICRAAESEATRRRKKTGALVRWTDVIFERLRAGGLQK